MYRWYSTDTLLIADLLPVIRLDNSELYIPCAAMGRLDVPKHPNHNIAPAVLVNYGRTQQAADLLS